MVLCPAVSAERWATRPWSVARVTRCMRSSSWRMLRQVSPAAFSIDPDEQQRQPAQLDVGADAVLAVVEHRAQPERALHVAPAAFDGDQLLVGGGQVVGGQGEVGGAQQPLAVQVLLAAGSRRGRCAAARTGCGAGSGAAPAWSCSEPTSSSRRRAVQPSEPSINCSRWATRLARTCWSRSAASGLWQTTNRCGPRPVRHRRRPRRGRRGPP